jgi:hypothetical protein
MQLPHCTRAGSTAGTKAILTKDLKSLSGGERSFTCVSFVLSLGKEIATPFFAMDEFDVFMDAVNRKVSLTSILKFAWEMQVQLCSGAVELTASFANLSAVFAA